MRRFSSPAPPGPLRVRPVIIMTIATSIGAAAGALTYLTCHSFLHALLVASKTTGSSASLLNQITDGQPKRPLTYEHNQREGQDGEVSVREGRTSAEASNEP